MFALPSVRQFAILVAAAVASGLPPARSAPVAYSGIGVTYLESFDSLPSAAGESTWMDGATLPGWHALAGGVAPFSLITANGSSSQLGRIVNAGPSGGSDRSLASQTASGQAVAPLRLGLCLRNDTGETLRRLDVAFVGEQWRLAGGDLPDRFDVEFRIGVAGTGSLDAASGWTPIETLAFIAPRTGTTTSALDGRAAANRVAQAATLAGIVWNPGEELWLRWSDKLNDATGNRRHLIALNDVSVRASRGLELTGLTRTPGGLRLEWDSAGQLVAIEESTDLQTWTRIAQGVSESFYVRAIPAGQPRTFLRVVLSPPGSVQSYLPGLIAYWGFSEPAGSARVSSVGGYLYRLVEAGGPVQALTEGPVSGTAVRFSGTNYLTMPRSEFVGTPLDRKGPGARVSLVAWVRRMPKTINPTQLEYLGGPWNEDGLRQYGLFINESNRQKTTAHISNVGVGTGSGEFNTTYARGITSVPYNAWVTLGLTYDGAFVRVYYNGVLDGSLAFTGDIYDPEAGGKIGSDFTLGANWAKGGLPAFVIRNYFKGDVGGLAVYDRALTDPEMQALHPAAF